jgi:hypothetical protein
MYVHLRSALTLYVDWVANNCGNGQKSICIQMYHNKNLITLPETELCMENK